MGILDRLEPQERTSIPSQEQSSSDGKWHDPNLVYPWYPGNIKYEHYFSFCVHNTEETYNNERKEQLIERMQCVCDSCRGINEYWVEGSLTTNTGNRFPINVTVYLNWYSNKTSDVAFLLSGIFAMMCFWRDKYTPINICHSKVITYRHLAGGTYHGNNFFGGLAQMCRIFGVDCRLRDVTLRRYKNVFKTDLIVFDKDFDRETFFSTYKGLENPFRQ